MEFNDSNMETSYSCGVLPMKENVVEPLSEEAIPLAHGLTTVEVHRQSHLAL